MTAVNCHVQEGGNVAGTCIIIIISNMQNIFLIGYFSNPFFLTGSLSSFFRGLRGWTMRSPKLKGTIEHTLSKSVKTVEDHGKCESRPLWQNWRLGYPRSFDNAMATGTVETPL